MKSAENSVTYNVTGVTRNGRRFKIVTSNAIHAAGINLWRGTLWRVLPGGRREIVRRVWN